MQRSKIHLRWAPSPIYLHNRLRTAFILVLLWLWLTPFAPAQTNIFETRRLAEQYNQYMETREEREKQQRENSTFKSVMQLAFPYVEERGAGDASPARSTNIADMFSHAGAEDERNSLSIGTGTVNALAGDGSWIRHIPILKVTVEEYPDEEAYRLRGLEVGFPGVNLWLSFEQLDDSDLQAMTLQWRRAW